MSLTSSAESPAEPATSAVTSTDAPQARSAGAMADSGADAGVKAPIRMLHDRVLVELDSQAGERRSAAGIVIPATAKMGRRLTWSRVVAVGGNVRTIEEGDTVLFDPEDRSEVELHGREYLLLRERDIHAVASERNTEGTTGLYL